MANPDLFVNAVVSLATAAIYVYVGRLMWSRPLPPGARLASRLFGVWWIALATLFVLTTALLVPASIGVTNLALTTAILYVLVIVIAVALWGLLYYLLYVYTGTERWLWPLTAFYGVFAFALIYLVTWMHPVGVGAGGFALQIDYERRLEGPASTALGLLISLPALAAAIAYGSLYFKAEGPTERFRIGLVSLAFIVWFGWSGVSSALQLSQRFPDSVPILLVGRAVGLLGPLLVLLAYRPPASLRRRYHLRSVDEAPE